MNRLTAVPVLALVLTVACEDVTGRDRHQPQVGEPSLQVVPSDAECVGTLPPGTYQNVIVPEGQPCIINNSTITGNIKALAGSQLTVGTSSVEGSIQAEKAVQVLISGGSVSGGIEIFDGPGASGFLFDYDIRFVSLTRNIHLVGNTGSIRVEANILPTGNITAADNVIPSGSFLVIEGNIVAGSIHVIKNTGDIAVHFNTLPGDTPGNIKIEDNVIPTRLLIQRNDAPQNLQVFKNIGIGFKTVTANTASESVQCKENTQPFGGGGNTAPKLEDQCGAP